MQRPIFLLIVLLLFSKHVFAVGFEQTKLHSHLGEPLDVRVGLLLDDGEDLTQSRVGLASPREYHALEQTLPQSYYDIRVDIKGANTSAPVVHITSEKPIDESIMALILKVKRGRGNYFKRIQLFLDAAPHMQMKKKAALKKVPETVARFSPVAISAEQGLQKAGSVEAEPQVNSGGWSRRDRYGPVQYGDSLSEIAYRLRKDKRWSNRQIMLALYQTNPDAFVNQNINQLKKGRFLTVPDDAAVKAFVNSERYQTLSTSQSPVKVKPVTKNNQVQKVKKEKPEVEEKQKPKFQGRISLGIAEPVDIPVVDVMMLKRLEKLEPLYEQVMASDLRMDDIGGKVDLLAKEVSQLHQKIDALSMTNANETDEGTSYGWIGFFLLLVINIALAAMYFYRKQMKEWQVRLTEAQQQNIHTNQVTKFPNDFESGIAANAYEENSGGVDEKSAAEELSQLTDGATSRSDAFIAEDVTEVEAKPTSTSQVLSEEPVEDTVVRPMNYALSFEEMVHKRDWIKADKYYNKLSEEEYNRPRIQALLVEKLHGQGDVFGRNITLLTLFNLYEDKEWHRFCSFFDNAVWQTLQDENIITYTGKVNEAEVDRIGMASSLQRETHTEVFDFSDKEEVEDSAQSKLSLSDDALTMNETASLQGQSIEETLSQGSGDFEETLQMDEAVSLETKPTASNVKVEDDEGLEVDFEFDFSVLESEEKPQSDAETSSKSTFEHEEKFDTGLNGSISLELEDSDLDEKKD